MIRFVRCCLVSVRLSSVEGCVVVLVVVGVVVVFDVVFDGCCEFV